jgi:hypothetical protein
MAELLANMEGKMATTNESRWDYVLGYTSAECKRLAPPTRSPA